MRKIISAALAFAMLAAAAPVYAADTEKTVRAEEAAKTGVGAKYSDAIEFIGDLGLLSGEVKADEPAQRGALAELAVLSVGRGIHHPADTPFDDVKSDDPRSGYILAAKERGLMMGYSDSIFEPNGSVSLEQLTVVLTRMTGYSAIAEISGGTVGAYMQAANKAGLLRGVSVKDSGAVTFGELAYAIERALDIDIMDMDGITSDKTVYDSRTGKNLLNSSLNITEVKGQITADYFTGLSGASNLNGNQVEIGRRVYTTTKENISEYLGWNVTAYIDTDGIVKAVKKTEYEDSEITILSGDIESVSNNCVNYRDENGNIRKANYSGDGYLIYNGGAKLAWSEADLRGVNNGKIRMLDTDNNGSYDVIFADQYTDMSVNSVSLADETVYFKPGSALASIDISEKSKLRYDLRSADGSKITIKDVPKGFLLSVAMSIDGKVCKLVSSKNYIVGICTGIDADSIIIGDEEFPLSGALAESGAAGLKSEGTFYINFLGNVAVFDQTALYNYGYLKRIGYKSGIGTEMVFELLSAEGTLQTFYLADKVRMNEASAKIAPSDIVGNSLLFKDAETIPQLITYNLNGEGKISKFSTAADGTSMTYEQKNGVFSRDAVFAGGGSDTSTRYIGSNWKMFAGRYLLDEDTKIFFIPEDTDQIEKYTVAGISSLANETFYGNIQIYDEDENNKVKALVIPADGVSNINRDSPAAVVKNVKKVLNSDGDYDDAVTVITGGKEVVLTCADDRTPVRMNYAMTDADRDEDYAVTDGNVRSLSLGSLNRGDVICYSAASDGKVNDAEVLLRANSPIEKEVWPGTTGNPTAYYFYRERYAAYAAVEAVIENGIRAEVPSGENVYTRVFPFSSGTSVLRFENDSVEEISAGDIAPGDKVFVYAGVSGVKLAVVYR